MEVGSMADPRCSAPEAPTRVDVRWITSVGMSEDLSWRRPVAVTS